MELTERVQRPLRAGVIFLDIVGYSRLVVETQYVVKKHFNRHLGDALANVPAQERLMLDTGDGAAVCFFGRPEAALLSAVRLRHATMFEPVDDARYELRTGIHLGHVRVIRDLNERLNVVGDGINDAQRVMSFAEPSQILASEAFHELIARNAADHARLFSYLGVRHDKHEKEHVVYEVGATTGPARSGPPRSGPPPAERYVADQAPRWTPSPQLLEGVRAVLVRFVGPVADPLIRRAAQSSASESELYMRLAAGIDSDDDRVSFLELVGAFGRARR